MSRPSLPVVVFALVLTTAAVAGAANTTTGATTPVVGTSPDAPNHLAINDSAVAASNTTAVDLDVGTALAADSAALQATYVESSYHRAIANAATEANRTGIRARVIDRLANETASLREANRAAIRAYAADEISAAELLRKRARITTRAEELHTVVVSIETSPFRFRASTETVARLNEIDGRLGGLQGPISASTARQLVDSGGGSPVYVEASDTGYTFAIVTDEAYTRETFLGSNWQPNEPDRYATGNADNLAAAKDRLVRFYPWVADNKEGGGGTFRAGGVYYLTWVLPGGELTPMLSGATGQVFRESQTRVLASFETTRAVNRTNGSLRLTVNRTYETGPARLTLRSPTTGEPIDGTVTIGGGREISVGDDGTYWFVDPRGDVRINATAGSSRVSVTLAGS